MRRLLSRTAPPLAVLGIVGTISVTANGADSSGLYIGTGIGAVRYDIDYSSQVQNAYDGSAFTVQSATLTRDSDVGYKAFVGYQLVPNFALELAYVDLGKPKAHYDLGSEHGVFSRDATYRIRGMNLGAIGSLALSDTFSFHGTLGAFYSELKYSETGTDAPAGEPHTFTAPNRRRADFSFGLGATWRLRDQWAIRCDWDRFRNIGKTFDLTPNGNGRFGNVDLFSMNVVYLFR